MSIFGFAYKLLMNHGSILLFHDDDFQMLREIKSYLEIYRFKIQSKFFVVNSLKHMNIKFKEKKIAFFFSLAYYVANVLFSHFAFMFWHKLYSAR